ncbi:bis(5'-nucleosyl)-tetraphosphatase (symmetrical) YqeK [Selenomonas sp. TAMA-11512]|uniref:bis(5'-nucleosyl)-tetraphosphatase (symmetrical) YqeK n=1 Tax=Selenomonas sp. TAMA-11512 TaxID=3095337 RepID=UPI00309115EC|nr:bis(5'-nucleosyl)-tetraphosphatase (symmetrical) YqeK [Selenomonas sp. TAMA-11512]
MTAEEMKAELERRILKKRYLHSLGVMHTAVEIAERLGMPAEQVRTAALLHDCGREIAVENMVEEAEKRGIEVGEIERAMPLLLHAPLGSKIAEEVYGVQDPVILQAIALHTVGAASMTDLDKLIYFADMIEPMRKYPEVEELRRFGREALLDEMFFAGVSASIAFVIEKKGLLHPATVAARNALLLKR